MYIFDAKIIIFKLTQNNIDDIKLFTYDSYSSTGMDDIPFELWCEIFTLSVDVYGGFPKDFFSLCLVCKTFNKIVKSLTCSLKFYETIARLVSMNKRLTVNSDVLEQSAEELLSPLKAYSLRGTRLTLPSGARLLTVKNVRIFLGNMLLISPHKINVYSVNSSGIMETRGNDQISKYKPKYICWDTIVQTPLPDFRLAEIQKCNSCNKEFRLNGNEKCKLEYINDNLVHKKYFCSISCTNRRKYPTFFGCIICRRSTDKTFRFIQSGTQCSVVVACCYSQLCERKCIEHNLQFDMCSCCGVQRENMIVCRKCKIRRYCSSGCENLDKEYHERVCQ